MGVDFSWHPLHPSEDYLSNSIQMMTIMANTGLIVNKHVNKTGIIHPPKTNNNIKRINKGIFSSFNGV